VKEQLHSFEVWHTVCIAVNSVCPLRVNRQFAL
jgi:hypothetical protein